ncbi:MAG: cytochrome c oxidase assembly protein [Gemmatimonadetes bacterium]|nr:cytochrome c oxidase assembly protein [Gemmatimonadota bacterium]
MQFWCKAEATAWTWGWTAYVGVWGFIVLLVVAVVVWNRSAARRAGEAPAPLHPLFAVGVLILWLALDWPIGPLGASHLASVHMLQFLLIGLVAPPLLLRGISPAAQATIANSAIMQQVTSPLFALAIFNVTVLVTHLPFVADALMPSQLGSMAIDLAWLVTGCFFWWPIVVPVPVRAKFPPPLRMLYLIGGLMFSPIMFGLAGFLAYSETPMYGWYELAPPLPGISSRDDHQAAGALMSIGGALVAFIGLSVIFFNWSKTEG